ncbi:DUF6049 family protein [Microbacterium sp. 179-B 1A2 NHS]|uniref:DUF6049 family protein n=1 Tax=Microbacterium sp. 179-B 1A2 NHS TaxID=3142383 RepID=UPI0039A2BCFE
MTFTSPVPGRRPAPSTRIARVAASATAILALLAPLPAAAATDDGDSDPASVELTLAPTNSGVVGPGDELVLSLTAVNPGDAGLPAGEIEVELGDARLPTEAALDRWLTGGSARGAFDDIATTDVEAVNAQDESALTLTVDEAEGGFDDLAHGVYPLRARYAAGSETVTARSVVVVPRTTASTGSVAVVVPITAGPLTTGLVSAEALAELTGPEGALRAQLDAVTATPAILAVDPAIAASIRVLGSSAPVEAVTWLDELLALPNDRFALQFGDADLAAQVGAGLRAPLEVDSFAPYLDAADFQPDPGVAPTPTPAATPQAVELPSVAEILDVGATRDAVFWPATGTAGAETAMALDETDSTSDAPLTLLPTSAVRSGDAGMRATADEADLLLYDAEASADLSAASTTGRTDERLAGLAAFTARATFRPASDPLLVTVDRAAGRSSAALRDAVLTATGLPGRDAIGLDAAAEGDPAPVTLHSVEPDAARTAAISSFRDAQPALAQVATTLADPDLLTANERATELQLLGNAWLDQPEQWTEAIAAHAERVAAWSDGVAIVPGSDIYLAGSRAPLFFTVRNDLPWPATVDLLSEPTDARIVVQSVTTVVVGAEQTARVEVPVEALVGTGESSIDLQLRTPTGVLLGDTSNVAVSVQAEWESVAVVGLTVLVTALIVLGIVRTVIRRRRLREEAASDGRAG